MARLSAIALLLALTAACRWNQGQQAVYDSYALMSEALEEERFEDLYQGLSHATTGLLDTAATVMTGLGAPLDNRGDRLLEEIASSRTLFPAGRNVADITLRGDLAVVEPAGEDDQRTVAFVFEDGLWRMDLTEEITDVLTGALQGSGTTLREFLHPEGPGAATPAEPGGCPLMVTNLLDGPDVYYLFVSPSVSDDWGPDVLGSGVLLPGSSCTLYVYPDTYDLMAVDAQDNSYTRWGVGIAEEGYGWDIHRSDLVQQ